MKTEQAQEKLNQWIENFKKSDKWMFEELLHDYDRLVPALNESCERFGSVVGYSFEENSDIEMCPVKVLTTEKPEGISVIRFRNSQNS